MVTCRMCMRSITFCISSTGQGAPAIMPVRRLVRSHCAKRGCSSMAMNMVGTPCSAVQRSASMVLEHGFGVEALVRVDHRRAVRDADEIAEHHAEAVVQRHGNTQAIDLAELHRRADEVAVVEDVVMRERGALGLAGGARRELNVDRVIELQRRRRRTRGAPAQSRCASLSNASKFSIPGVLSSPSRITSESEGSAAAASFPGLQCASSGASSCSISR